MQLSVDFFPLPVNIDYFIFVSKYSFCCLSVAIKKTVLNFMCTVLNSQNPEAIFF